MRNQWNLSTRLSALIDQLDAHVTGTPEMTLGQISAELDDLLDDVQELERGTDSDA